MILLLLITLLPLNAAAAPDALSGPPVPERGDRAGQFAADWDAAKVNNELLSAPLTNLGTLGDMDAHKAQGEVMKQCAETAISGRKDSVCETDPSHPECVGSKQAITNATTCREYFDPARPDLGCKIMGAGRYEADVWLAFAETFVSAAVDCSVLKASAEDRLEKKQLFKPDGTPWEINGNEVLANAGESLTVMLNPVTTTGAAVSPNRGPDYRPSTVSGSVKKETPYSPGDWNEISKTLNDGSSRLGLEEGEILRLRAEGKSFSEIIKSSPFFDGLNAEAQLKLGGSLEETGSIVNRVKQERAEELGAAIAENTKPNAAPTPASPNLAYVSGSDVITASGSSRNGLPSQLVALSADPPPGPKKAALGSALASLPENDLVKEATLAAAKIAEEEENQRVRRTLEAERIAQLAAAARKARPTGRSLASVLAEAPDAPDARQFSQLELFQLSLFARIQHAYQKIRPKLLPPPPAPSPPTPAPGPPQDIF
jgi:hypothetical protein